MSKVKILLGSHGSGKSEFIYNLLYKNAFNEKNKIDLNKKLFLVVPEQDTQEKQKKMMQVFKNNGKGFINMDVISFDRLCYNVFDLLNIDIDKNKMVQDDAKTLLLRLAIRNLKKKKIKFPYFEKSLKKIGFYEKLTSCMSEFYTYNIGEEELKLVSDKTYNKLIQQKIIELSYIQKEFLQLLNKKGFKIKEDKLNLLKELLPKTKYFEDAIVCFDGFTGFTPIQRDIFSIISNQSKEVYVSIDYRLSDFNISDYNDIQNNTKNVFNISRVFIRQIKKSLNDVNINFDIKKDILYIYNAKATSQIDINQEGTEEKYLNKNKNEELYLIEKKLFKYNLSSKNNKKNNKVCIYQLKNIDEETTFLINIIEKLVREEKCKYNDIKVVVPNIDDYRDYIINKVEKYDIPLFIDDSHTILNSPYIETIRAALEVIDTNFSQNSVERYINSGIIHKNKKYYLYDQAIRKYVLNNKIKFQNRLKYELDNIKLKSQKDNFYFYDYVEENIELISNINDKIINPLIEFSNKIKKEQTIDEINEVLISFIKDINLDENFNNLYENEEKSIIYNNKDFITLKSSKEIFEKTINLMSLISDDEPISITDYRSLIDISLKSANVKSIPYSLDQVIVGDLMRSRYDNPKFLIFMGMSDSNIPKTSSDNNIINDEMRILFDKLNKESEKNIRLELSQTTIETTLNSRFYVYQALSNPTEKLILTWPNKNSENVVDKESTVIKDIKKLLNIDIEKIIIDKIKLYNIENIKEYVAKNIFETKNYLRRIKINKEKQISYSYDKEKIINSKITKDLYSFLNNNIELKKINENIYYNNPLLDKKNVILYDNSNEDFNQKEKKYISSASSIEEFASCPYKYFLNKTIGIKNINTIELNAMDIGNIFHKVLELFFDKYNIYEVSEDEIEKIITELIDRVLNEMNIFDDTNKSKFMIIRLKDIIVESVKVMKKQYSMHKTIKTIACEYGNFIYDIGNNNQIQGKIDKIDIIEDDENIYLRIIDYKSGDIKVDKNKIDSGVKIQFLIYLDYCYNHYDEIKTALRIIGKKKKIIPIGSFYSRIFDKMNIVKNNNDLSDLNNNIASNYSMTGIINEEVYDKIFKNSNTTEEIKTIYDISKELSLSEEEVKQELENAKNIMNKNINNIKDGVVLVKPYDINTVCEYCEYSAICKNEFEKSEDENDE